MVKKILNKILGTKHESSKFSRFFREASSRDRKKVFKEAARKASNDQRMIYFSDDSKIGNT